MASNQSLLHFYFHNTNENFSYHIWGFPRNVEEKKKRIKARQEEMTSDSYYSEVYSIRQKISN